MYAQRPLPSFFFLSGVPVNWETEKNEKKRKETERKKTKRKQGEK